MSGARNTQPASSVRRAVRSGRGAGWRSARLGPTHAPAVPTPITPAAAARGRPWRPRRPRCREQPRRSGRRRGAVGHVQQHADRVFEAHRPTRSARPGRGEKAAARWAEIPARPIRRHRPKKVSRRSEPSTAAARAFTRRTRSASMPHVPAHGVGEGSATKARPPIRRNFRADRAVEHDAALQQLPSRVGRFDPPCPASPCRQDRAMPATGHPNTPAPGACSPTSRGNVPGRFAPAAE